MPDEIKLYALDCAPFTDPALFQAYFNRLPLWRRQKTERIQPPGEKRLSLGAGVLLLSLFPETDLSKIRFGENGKPYFEDTGVSFNLSHAGQYALCAVGPGELGCDIELVRPFKERVAERFFHPSETAMLAAEPDPAKRQALFFRLWTLKESVLKAAGTGLTQPLNSFYISFENGVPAAGGLYLGVSLKEFTAPAGYALAACAPAGSRFAEGVQYLQIQ